MSLRLIGILLLAFLNCKASANDDFSQRTPLTGEFPIRVTSTHVGATGGGIHAARPSRWWTWTATQSGWHHLQLDSETPVSISVFKGDYLYQLLSVSESAPSLDGDPAVLPFLATAGESYEIAILGSPTSIPGPFSLSLSKISHPSPNDDFENSIDLGEALNVSISASNYGASKQLGEPDHDGFRPSSSVWWKISPSYSGIYRLGLPHPRNQHYRPRLSLYEGSQLSNLRLLKEFRTYTALSIPFETQEFTLEGGNTYHLAMDRPQRLGATEGSLKFSIVADPGISEPPPPNDNFEDAHDIGSSEYTSFTSKFTNATNEARDYVRPRSGIFDKLLNHTSWWKWTAPTTGLYGLTPLGFQDTDDHLHILKKNEDGSLTDISTRELQGEFFEAAAGETFFFMTGTLSWKKTKTIDFELRKIIPSLNRNRNTAMDLGGVDEFEVSGETLTQNGEPLVWRWKPSKGGNYRFFFDSTSGISGGHPPLWINEVNANGESTKIWLNQQGNFYPIKSDRNYFLSTYRLSRGFHSLKAVRLLDAINENFEEAIDLGATPYVRSTSSTYGAGLEESEPWTYLSRSIWWKWQAPESGAWQFTAFPDPSHPTASSTIEIFQGDKIDNLQSLGVAGYGGLSLSAKRNESYFIRIMSHAQTEHTLSITKGIPTINNLRSQPMDLGNSAFVEARGGYTQATAEPDEPGTGNLWWTWTSPEIGYYILQTRKGSEKSIIYTETQNRPISEWTQVQVSYFNNRTNNSIFKANKGERFMIVSYLEVGSGEGSGLLSISPFAPPEGDFFETPINLGNNPQLSHTGIGTNASFSHNDPQLCKYCQGSIWMTWQAPSTGKYEIEGQSIRTDNSDDGIGVYTGSDPTTLTQIAFAAENDDDDDRGESFTSFHATEGAVYRIVFFSEYAFDRFAVSITPVYSYEHWIESWQDYLAYWRRSPLTDQEASRGGNPNQDGISNFTKYVFGLNPTKHQGTDYNLRNLPTLSKNHEFLELKYRLGSDAFASEVIPLDHFGEWSTDGKNWHRTEPEPLGDRWFRVRTPIDTKRKLLRLQTVEKR